MNKPIIQAEKTISMARLESSCQFSRTASPGAWLLLATLSLGGAVMSGFSSALAADGAGSGAVGALSERPSERMLDKPAYQDGEEGVEMVLPPVPRDAEYDALPGMAALFVMEIRFVGHTAFSDKELHDLVVEFENREVTSGELQEIRHILTRHYIDRGYINSGALLPNQDVSDGVIEYQIVEGALTSLDISGTNWLTPQYLGDRLKVGAGTPLNIDALRQQMLILQQSPLIKRLNGELGPGVEPGESRLQLKVEEALPLRLDFRLSNNRSPAIGSIRGEVEAVHYSATGHGDQFGIRFGSTRSQEDWRLFYELPIGPWDTSLRIDYQHIESALIDEPFASLNVQSEMETIGLGVKHPFYRTPNQTFAMELRMEWRRSLMSDDLGSGFYGETYEYETRHDGLTEVTALRFIQDWLDRDQNRVIAARSTFSRGLKPMDKIVTDPGNSLIEGKPGYDGTFFSWLGQFQLAQRIGDSGHQALFRLDGQLSDDPLFSMEKFSIGGGSSVRGYRENEMLRDNGFTTSLEYSLPIWELPISGLSHEGEGAVRAIPFIDFGMGWNNDTDQWPDPKHISSAGLGLTWQPTKKILAELYWAHPFRNTEHTGHDLQDEGIHFQLSWQAY
ncbi:MAG: ShlB/FhaC/HecB family hemolysin secretion/activation protein [Magnetococcales bacterium]|nr:ShlB/FhaC/HecB family hemolysin secretion/activation protein [Magnetococcales bacterium]